MRTKGLSRDSGSAKSPGRAQALGPRSLQPRSFPRFPSTGGAVPSLGPA